MRAPSIHNITPRKLFLVDGIGALVTAISTGFLLPWCMPSVGVPLSVLKALAGVALLFPTFSLLSFYFFNLRWAKYLAMVAVANMVYCLVTLSVLFYFRESATAWALVYFLAEALVVAVLATHEWRARAAFHK
jgi:hypothetical protein